jgi:acyl CoA:acetate/3-ketoacid CoA transferase beta subunit
MTPDPDRDLYVVALARDIPDRVRLHIGANQRDVMLAALLARKLWAPGLMMVMNADFILGASDATVHLGRRCYDPWLVAQRRATFHQGAAFDDLRRAPMMIGGGLQVDGRGNANLIGIRNGDDYRLRGPGSAGLPTMTTMAARFVIGCPHHARTTLVPRVDAISILGDPVARREAGIDGRALVAVVTPKARFEPTDEGLLLTELAGDTTMSALRELTGFEVRVAREPGRRPPITPEEQAVLAELRAAEQTNQAVM